MRVGWQVNERKNGREGGRKGRRSKRNWFEHLSWAATHALFTGAIPLLNDA